MPPRTRRPEPNIDVVGDVSRFGPLGFENTRRQLGRSVLLTDTHTQDTLITCAAQNHADLCIGDGLAQQTVITCTLSYGPGRQPDSVATVLGRLEWGGDGHGYTVDFDWRQGTVIRPVGASFKLSAHRRISALALDGEPVPNNVDVNVGAWIGYGGATARSATLTQVAADGVALDVPPFCVGFTAYCGEPATVAYFVGTTAAGGGSIRSGSPHVLPGGGINRLSVTSGQRALIVWELGV
jgi:hypothetical protein